MSQDKPRELALALADKLLSAEDAIKQPAPAWLVSEYLHTDSLAMLYGPPGSYKSFVALDLAMCIASGLPWQGHEVQQGPVLYIAAEGRAGMSKRIEAWCTRFGPALDFHLFPQVIPLMDSERYVPAVAEMVRGFGFKFIVVDTLARSTAGGNENATADMGVFVNNLDQIRHAAGSCILTVHHTQKGDSKVYRGNSSLEGAMDSMFHLEADEAGSITMATTKQKEVEEAPDLMLYREVVPVKDNTATSCIILVSGTVRIRVLQSHGESQVVSVFLTGPPGLTLSAPALSEVAGLSRATLYRVLGALVRRGVLFQETSGRSVLYTLNPAHRQSLSHEVSPDSQVRLNVSPLSPPKKGESETRPETDPENQEPPASPQEDDPPTLECGQ